MKQREEPAEAGSTARPRLKHQQPSWRLAPLGRKAKDMDGVAVGDRTTTAEATPLGL